MQARGEPSMIAPRGACSVAAGVPYSGSNAHHNFKSGESTLRKIVHLHVANYTWKLTILILLVIATTWEIFVLYGDCARQLRCLCIPPPLAAGALAKITLALMGLWGFSPMSSLEQARLGHQQKSPEHFMLRVIFAVRGGFEPPER